MFDHLQQAAAGAWHDTLSYGDVVIFRFPVAEEDGGDAPKARPCLVLDVERFGDRQYTLLAYGTTQANRANRGYEIRVYAPEEYAAAGLRNPTRFVGARRILVPLDHADFALGPTGTPVIGRLSGAAFERMNAVRGRIHAEADIASERRAERRREAWERRQSHRRAAARPVIVERRKRREFTRPKQSKTATR